MKAVRVFKSPFHAIYRLTVAERVPELELKVHLMAEAEFANSEPKPEGPVLVAWLHFPVPCCGAYTRVSTFPLGPDEELIACDSCEKDSSSINWPAPAATYALLWHGTSIAKQASEEERQLAVRTWLTGAVDPLSQVLDELETEAALTSFAQAAAAQLSSEPWPPQAEVNEGLWTFRDAVEVSL